MSSFLANCPQCGVTYAAGSPCPQCRWSDSSQDVVASDNRYCEEFAVRQTNHRRNSNIHMILMGATGFAGLATALMWALFLYRGNVLGFIMIGVLMVTSAILGACTFLAKSRYPTTLFCPACDGELSDLGIELNTCPACEVQLIAEPGAPSVSQQDAEFVQETRETVGV